MSERQQAIGWIYPGAIDRVHLDFFAMTPPELNLVISTRMWALKMVHAGSFDAEAFERQREEILDAARELGRYQGIDYLIVSGDLIQSAMGPEWDRRLSDDLAREAGVPATTAMTALVDGLRHLGAERIAVATPFRDDQNEHIRRYLGAAGFEIASLKGVHTTSIQEIASLDPGRAADLVREAVAEAGTVDAVYVSCPVWRGPSASIEPLERELGVPVLAMFNPILWKALRELGHAAPVHGYGRLLASLGAGEPAGVGA